MPKISHPPKYCKLNGYAVVYHCGKPHYLGRYGSPKSKIAYSRFVAEVQANPTFFPIKEEKHVTVCELAAAFLDHVKANKGSTDYSVYRTIVLDFLDKLYGDKYVRREFKPSCLKLVRAEMIQSRRFCRNIVNRHTCRITSKKVRHEKIQNFGKIGKVFFSRRIASLQATVERVHPLCEIASSKAPKNARQAWSDSAVRRGSKRPVDVARLIDRKIS